MNNVRYKTFSQLKSEFSRRLINKFSSTELNLMFKYLSIKFNDFDETQYLLNLNSSVEPIFIEEIEVVIDKLLNDEPFQHIYGSVEFYGLEILVNKHVLIPRPETEELVDWIVNTSKAKSILDLCSGSGCISMALKYQYPNSNVTAIDISEKAIELSKSSCKKLDLEIDHRVENLFDLIPLNSCFDLIVSNPPYIPLKEKSELHNRVLNFEPHGALFVENKNPILFYEKIIVFSYLSLINKGLLFFECHPNYIELVKERMLNEGFLNIEMKMDLQGKNRFLKAEKN